MYSSSKKRVRSESVEDKKPKKAPRTMTDDSSEPESLDFEAL